MKDIIILIWVQKKSYKIRHLLFNDLSMFSQEQGVTEGVQNDLGMESGIINVLNIGNWHEHIDTNLKDWIFVC
jgi:hypothetical protein